MEKIAVGYLRCSTETQEDSTRQQQQEISSFAEKNGYKVIRWYEDFGESGTSFRKRPAFMDMLSCAASGKAEFSYIIAYDESRWGRANDPEENSYWEGKFKFEFGITLVLVHTMATTSSPLANSFLKSIQRVESSEYAKKLSTATLRGQKDNAKRGFSSGGLPPYGYRRIAVDKVTGQKSRDLLPGEHINQETEKSKWELGDPFEVQIVKRIFGERIKGIGFVTIADMLNRECIPPPKSGRQRNQDGKWSGGTVKAISENLTYTGSRVFNVHPQSHLSGSEKPLWINKREDWVIVENAHPAIVPREVFELANRNRQDYQRKNRYTDDSPYLLTGLIRCSHCGCKFYGQNQKQKSIRYYEDSGYISRGRSTCSSFKANKEKLESFVVKSIRGKILNSDLPLRLEKMLDENIRSRSVERLQDVEHCEKSLSEVRIRMERLLTLVENGAAIEELIDRIKEAEKEKKRIEQKLDELKLSNVSRKEIVEAKREVQYLMENFETILKTAPIPVQKELIRKFVHSIIVDRETSSVVVYLKAIPTLKTEVNTTSTCIKVEKKWDKKVKRQWADRQQTEASNVEINQSPETNESVFAQKGCFEKEH